MFTSLHPDHIRSDPFTVTLGQGRAKPVYYVRYGPENLGTQGDTDFHETVSLDGDDDCAGRAWDHHHYIKHLTSYCGWSRQCSGGVASKRSPRFPRLKGTGSRRTQIDPRLCSDSLRTQALRWSGSVFFVTYLLSLGRN